MDSMRFSGKTAWITGGGTGIGAATARRIAAEGGRVVLTGRRPEPIEALAAEIGGAALAGDTSDPDHVAAAVALAVDRFGGLDVLVANAGTGYPAALEAMDLDAWRRTTAVNLDGPMLATRAALPEMIRRGGGAIVHVASVAALRAIPLSSAYMATKAALVGLSRSIAFDYGPRGIRSNVVCPGLVPTDMARRGVGAAAEAQGTSYDDLQTRIAAVYPLRRAGTPEDLAGVIAFLASDDAAFVTGTVTPVDGGATVVDCAVLA